MQYLYLLVFNILKKRSYDSIIDLIWEQCDTVETKKLFELFRQSFLADMQMSEHEVRMNTKFLAATIYITDNFINSIKKNEFNIDSCLIYKAKIDKFKITWFESVVSFVNSNNSQKFILKEFKDKEQDRDTFVESKIQILRDWVDDKNSLASDFYYLSDLIKVQLNIILKNEPIFIILKEVFIENNEDLKAEIDNIMKNNSKQEWANVPNIILEDGIFRAGKISIDSNDSTITDEGESIVKSEPQNKLKLRIPKNLNTEALSINFDYLKDSLQTGGFELSTFVSLLQIAKNQLNESNKITFKFSQIFSAMGIEPGGWAYARVEKALLNLFTCSYMVELPDLKERYFHIISAIEKPSYNSDGEKEWTIEIDSLLREHIILKNLTTKFNAKQFSNYKSELAPILFKVLAFDLNNSKTNPAKYSINSLSARTFIEGKHSKRKERISQALTEIIEKNSLLIEKFEIVKDVIDIYFCPTKL